MNLLQKSTYQNLKNLDYKQLDELILKVNEMLEGEEGRTEHSDQDLGKESWSYLKKLRKDIELEIESHEKPIARFRVIHKHKNNLDQLKELTSYEGTEKYKNYKSKVISTYTTQNWTSILTQLYEQGYTQNDIELI